MTKTQIHCQEAVKKTSILSEVIVTPLMLKNLREELQQSLSEFGLTLKRAIDPKAEHGYTRQYISRLEHGKDSITPELVAAFYNLAAVLDEVPAGIGGAASVSLLAQPNQIPQGSFIPRSAKAIRCKRPGCSVIFIQTHPRQQFHDPDCRNKHKSR